MSVLSQIEKGTFLRLFNRCGYVLDFSTNDFDDFTMDSVGVALCAKYGLSKGKSLTEFVMKDAKDRDVIKLFKDLLDYYEENYEQEYTKDTEEDFEYSRYNAEYARLYQKCKTYIDRVMNVTTPLVVNAENLKKAFQVSIYQNK